MVPEVDAGVGVQMQMAAKGPEDDDLYEDDGTIHPLFTSVFKRHSHMASDEAEYPFKGMTMTYAHGGTASIEIPESGNAFISHMYVHINMQHFLRSATHANGTYIPYYVKNNIGLRCIKRIKVYTPKYTVCDLDSDGMYILYKSFYAHKPGYKVMIGDYDLSNPKLVTSVLSPHIYVPIPLWFSANHQNMFPLCLLGEPLRVHVEFEKGSALIEEKFDDDFHIAVTLIDDGFGVRMDLKVEYPNTDGTSSVKYADENQTAHMASLLVQYAYPTDNELAMIKDDRTMEYVVPQVFRIEDVMRLRQHDVGQGVVGTAQPSLEQIHHPIKMFFFVVKYEKNGIIEPFYFQKIETILINDRIVQPNEMECLQPYTHEYTRVQNVYSYCASLDPRSGHPSGHVYITNTDTIRVTVDTSDDALYTNKYVVSYAVCNTVYRFSRGEMSMAFI